jgi:hypothetical protein
MFNEADKNEQHSVNTGWSKIHAPNIKCLLVVEM